MTSVILPPPSVFCNKSVYSNEYTKNNILNSDAMSDQDAHKKKYMDRIRPLRQGRGVLEGLKKKKTLNEPYQYQRFSINV